MQDIKIKKKQENKTPIKPDKKVIKIFKESLYKKYKDFNNIDILMENTDFGVGGDKENE